MPTWSVFMGNGNNNTAFPPPNILSMDLPSIDGESLRIFWAKNQVRLEVLWLFVSFAPILSRSARYFTNPNLARRRKFPPAAVVFHIIASVVELIRYYTLLSLQGTPPGPTPTWLDLALCATHSLSAFFLTPHVSIGNVALARTAFQTMSVMRMFASTVAFRQADAGWHRVSIKMLNAFVWVRWSYATMSCIAGFPTYGVIYSAGLVAAGPIAVWESGYPFGIPMLYVVAIGFLALDKWGANRVNVKGLGGSTARFLRHIGFVTIPKIEKVEEKKEETKVEKEGEMKEAGKEEGKEGAKDELKEEAKKEAKEDMQEKNEDKANGGDGKKGLEEKTEKKKKKK